MCGIAGELNFSPPSGGEHASLEDMIGMLRHRGPDGYGFYRDERIGLAHARLSIIDLEGGWQPIPNEDKTLWIVFNGEIFNYVELRRELEQRGHRFATHSDTEVIVHLFEERGADALRELNGQFAFAIWDRRRSSLFLARDRVGIRPLFHTRAGGSFLFASEIKALFADPRVEREIDPQALDQVFTFWMSLAPRSAFRGIAELPAGHYLEVGADGRERLVRWWDPDFAPDDPGRAPESYAEELGALLLDATRLQLRADVPVGAYLSGGLDSSVITTLIRRFSDTPLRSFSVTFRDAVYDESEYQQQVISHLGTDHSSIACSNEDIGRIFPEVIWHTEKPVVRTAPAPLMMLSRLVRTSGYKVVLTGEGSDEILAGYDIFKEAKIRRFLARFPDSKLRPQILKRLYPYLEHSPIRSLSYAESFFKVDASRYPGVCYAHVPRWNTTEKTKVFFSAGLRDRLRGGDALGELESVIDAGAAAFDPLSQAQYLEIKTLLSGYLLSSQGDRVAMANSIEGRFPFLDHRVMEFCFRLPPHLRMKALTEKYLLKKAMGPLLPPAVAARTKQPYMAPDARSFVQGHSPEYVDEVLSPGALERAGYFDPKAVAMLVRKCRTSPVLGFKDNMALVGVLSTMLLHAQYVEGFAGRAAQAGADVRSRTRCDVRL